MDSCRSACESAARFNSGVQGCCNFDFLTLLCTITESDRMTYDSTVMTNGAAGMVKCEGDNTLENVQNKQAEKNKDQLSN